MMEPHAEVQRQRKTHACVSCEDGKCDRPCAPPVSTHTSTHTVPILSHCDTDGANMKDVSGVARERYLLPR